MHPTTMHQSLCVGAPNLPLPTPLLTLSICCCCHRWNLRFLESDFRGQLPCHYSPHDNSTSVVPDHMNDLNREELSRYVSVCNDSCVCDAMEGISLDDMLFVNEFP